jgi:hypothetical protein
MSGKYKKAPKKIPLLFLTDKFNIAGLLSQKVSSENLAKFYENVNIFARIKFVPVFRIYVFGPPGSASEPVIYL